MINYNITAVLAANRNLPLLESFYEMFRRDFPEIPIVISMLQAPEGFKEWASNIEDPNTTILQGSPKDGHNVSFSELYNAGINAVQTKNLVLIHDDMVFDEDFFRNLDRDIDRAGTFLEYYTVEPPTGRGGDIRNTKGICDFGSSFNTFDIEGFRDCCRRLKQNASKELKELSKGFFLGGPKELFEKVGGFDQNTFMCFCEDDDFYVRMLLQGYQLLADKAAICYHFGSQTSRSIRTEISKEEVNSNRRFVSKWGFECRTIMNRYKEIPLDFRIRCWKVGGEGFDEKEMECVRYFAVKGNLVPKEEANFFLEKTTDKGVDLGLMLRVLGQLGISQKEPKVGTYKYPGFQVHILNPKCSSFREDTKNYLLLQREIEYE